MNQQLQQYIQSVNAFLQEQEKRIRSLERTINELKKELMKIKEKPSIHVDKIEYKFDQLKVESLDGTLNIGLNPSDLQNIDEFAVNNQDVKTPLSPKERMNIEMEIEEAIYQFLESELPTIVTDIQMKTNRTIDDSLLTFIKEDIKKQLPQRIEHYLKQYPLNEKIETMINQLKMDIKNGIITFISQMPHQ
ncbi:spore germination protein GerPC [Bacillus sp. 03113]|uniref:spore germination protein GerPC n=1 Tax=Bacillus sp. 03113 TaxID=2578211 RepID=UPI00215C2086|nr:spore germination protein GerPC [Bacillus sp. 03113]